jgi:hypothetical protein
MLAMIAPHGPLGRELVRHRPELLRERDPKKLIPPLHSALPNNEQDVHPFERLAFANTRHRCSHSGLRQTRDTSPPALPYCSACNVVEAILDSRRI